MGQYTLSPSAQRSIEDINSYTTREHGDKQAIRYLEALRDRMLKLADQPTHGLQRDDIKSGYYCYFQGAHTIYYTVAGPATIAVIDVLHQRMDPQRHLAASGRDESD